MAGPPGSGTNGTFNLSPQPLHFARNLKRCVLSGNPSWIGCVGVRAKRFEAFDCQDLLVEYNAELSRGLVRDRAVAGFAASVGLSLPASRTQRPLFHPD